MAAVRSEVGTDPSARVLRLQPLRRFIGLGAVSAGALIGATTALGLPALAVAGAAGALAGGILCFAVRLRHRHPHRRLGLANVVTQARLTVVALLVGVLLAGGGHAALVVSVSIGALALDGLDGFLARRQRTQSDFGASFDMEVDAAFGLVLAALAALGPAGPVALLLGLPRYLFGIGGWVLPWLRGRLDERFSRKVVCVVQLIALIALQLPMLPTWLALVIVAVTATALAWSFGTDVRLLSLQRMRPSR